MRQRILGTILLCLITTTSNAALLGRAPLTPGGTDYQAYYDDVLNITWLADANYAKTSGFHGNDLLSWYEASSFIADLNNTSHLGIESWRLPSMDVNADAYIVKCSVATDAECLDNELGYMSVIYAAASDNPLVFENVLFNYWSSTDYDADNVDWPGGATCNVGEEGLCAWRQGFGFDSQNYVRKTYGEPYDSINLGYSVWAVASGDAAAVPLPAAVWLFGGALSAIGWLRRRASRA